MDFPRRALFDEPEDIDPYVAKRSRGFTPADRGDQLDDQFMVRPARAARAPEPTNTTDSARPRRASFAEWLTADADEEKSTATEAGIGRRAMDPLPGRLTQSASPPERATPVPPPPSATSPEPRRSVPTPGTGQLIERATVQAHTPADDSRAARTQTAPLATPPLRPAAPRSSAVAAAAPTSAETPAATVRSVPTTKTPPVRTPAPIPQSTVAPPTRQLPAQGNDRSVGRAVQPAVRRADPIAVRRTDQTAVRRTDQTARRTDPTAVRRTDRSRRTVNHEVPPIIIDRLVKSYNGLLAVRDLSFVVEPGRVTGFLGPNGAGKTTTMRILVGLTSPTTGTATFGDLRYAELPHPQRTVGCVLDASFHPARSGRNHLRVLAPTAGVSDRRIDKLLDVVGLTDVARRSVGEYSTGMRQRLALAAAMLGNPDYLILDEPANGLDPEGIRWLREFLRDFAESGRAVLISSHLLNEIQATADDIVVINKGRLLAQMPMSELTLGEGTTRARVSDVRTALHVLAATGADVETAADERGAFLRIRSHDVGQVGSVLFSSGIAVEELITERRDLEQEFFSMLDGSR
ncbi:MAG TPA: ATP-binding cassette domain-containing protein [Propionibacteriaceae bacterium]|nr:ATP-binding cassette domain-containing protein [Propionibacteriaceae bacterium]